MLDSVHEQLNIDRYPREMKHSLTGLLLLWCRSSYEVNVTENKLPGTPVLRVKVSQHRPGASLTFTIVPSQTKFYINTSTVSDIIRLVPGLVSHSGH